MAKVYRTKIGMKLLKRVIIIAMSYLCCLVILMVYLNLKTSYIYTKNAKIDDMKDHMQSLAKALVDQETGQRGYDLTGEKQFLQPYYSGTKDFSKQAKEIQTEVNADPRLKHNVQEMIDKGSYWHTHFGEPQVAKKSAGKHVDGPSLLEGKTFFDQFRLAAQRAIDQTGAYEKQNYNNLSKLTLDYHIGLMILSFALFGLLVFFILRAFEQLASPITKIQHAVMALAKGDFDYELPRPNKQPDELTELIQSLEVMRHHMERTLNQTKQQAETDALTGISNRRYFDLKLAHSLSEFYTINRLFSLIILDLDKFKGFNDTFGHMEGDRLLKHVAGTIMNLIHPPDHFVRYGGEEFVILTLNADPASLAEKLRAAIEETPLDDLHQVTASFGVSQVIEGDDANSLFNRADQALYKAKQNGRNQVVVAKEPS